MKTCILFCCHKAAIYYMTHNKSKIKCIFQENIGRRYMIKIDVLDDELKEQYSQSEKMGNLFVIDVNDESLNHKTESDDDKIKLNHMGVIIPEKTEGLDENYPVLNIYNLGLLCFISCSNCNQDACPGKSPCSKLPMDVIRLWNTMGYNPTKYNETNVQKIKDGLTEMYDNQTDLYNDLPEFIRKQI